MSLLYEAEFDADTIRSVMVEVRQLLDGIVSDGPRLMTMARELADNAVYHSGRGGGWCAVERSAHHLTVVIRDRGVGIHQSLRESYSDLSEREALRRVFGGGVSATADPDRGLGLRMVLDHTTRGPTLLLETGGVAFVGVGGRGRVVAKSTQRVEGVLATLRAPLLSAIPADAPN